MTIRSPSYLKPMPRLSCVDPSNATWAWPTNRIIQEASKTGKGAPQCFKFWKVNTASNLETQEVERYSFYFNIHPQFFESWKSPPGFHDSWLTCDNIEDSKASAEAEHHQDTTSSHVIKAAQKRDQVPFVPRYNQGDYAGSLLINQGMVG